MIWINYNYNYNYNNLFLTAALPILFAPFFAGPAALGPAALGPAALCATALGPAALGPASGASAHEIIATTARVDGLRTGWLHWKIITAENGCVRTTRVSIPHAADHSAFRWHCWDVCIIGCPAGRVSGYPAIINRRRH